MDSGAGRGDRLRRLRPRGGIELLFGPHQGLPLTSAQDAKEAQAAVDTNAQNDRAGYSYDATSGSRATRLGPSHLMARLNRNLGN